MKDLLLKLCSVVLLVALTGCGSGSSFTSGGTGAITAKLEWSQAKSSSIGETLGIRPSTAPSGVVTVRIIVEGSDMANIQKDFPASDGKGLIDDVPAGTSRTITAQGLDSGGNVTFQGSIGNVTVVSGQTTDVGTITMLPVGGTPEFSNATLIGQWLLTSTQGKTTYIVFDGNGGITEAGLFNMLTPPGNYQVQANGSLTITLNFLHDPQTILSGALASSTTGAVTVTQGNDAGETGNIIKVSNLAACQGTWTGTLTESGSTTHAISFAIDGNGTGTSFTGFARPVSGKMFCEAGAAAAFFKTGETNSYDQIQISGVVSGNNITGTFDNDSPPPQPTGTVALTQGTSGGGGALPAGFPTNVPAGDYRIDVSVCVQGNCFNGQPFTTTNNDINQFAQNLVDALNAAAAQHQTSCSQAGISCNFTISYTPWNGTSFTITDNIMVTTANGTASASVIFTVTKIT